MPDLEIGKDLPDLNKQYLTDPEHIPCIQKSFNGDRVAPVELSIALLERMIGCSSGIVKDQPRPSFVAFDQEMDSELPFVSQNDEGHVVPTHEDGDSNFLELLSLLHNLLKLSGEHESVYIMGTLMFRVLQVQTLDC